MAVSNTLSSDDVRNRLCESIRVKVRVWHFRGHKDKLTTCISQTPPVWEVLLIIEVKCESSSLQIHNAPAFEFLLIIYASHALYIVPDCLHYSYI